MEKDHLDCKQNKGEAFEEEINSFLPHELFEDAEDILTSVADSLDENMSQAYCYLDDILYIRIFDGERYVFPLPFMLSDDADMTEACMNLSVYSRREMIPLIITDIPRDDLDFLSGIFPHFDASCYGDDDDSFFIKVNNECDLLDDIPIVSIGNVTLDAITNADTEAYAALCSDASLNRFWGYDVREDNPDGAADYYLRVAKREFYDGVAITFAIRHLGEFAGEAVIYDFDYLGSAQIAVRVLPTFGGRGIGSLATEALIKVAKDIGLSSLRAEIMNENEASIKMTSKFMDLEKVEKGKTKFTLLL